MAAITTASKLLSWLFSGILSVDGCVEVMLPELKVVSVSSGPSVISNVDVAIVSVLAPVSASSRSSVIGVNSDVELALSSAESSIDEVVVAGSSVVAAGISVARCNRLWL